MAARSNHVHMCPRPHKASDFDGSIFMDLGMSSRSYEEGHGAYYCPSGYCNGTSRCLGVKEKMNEPCLDCQQQPVATSYVTKEFIFFRKDLGLEFTATITAKDPGEALDKAMQVRAQLAKRWEFNEL